MASYNEWLALARRYDKVVDFGSPMSAWTPAMLREYRERQEKVANEPLPTPDTDPYHSSIDTTKGKRP